MLVIARKVGESVRVGDTLIEILESTGPRTVRLGIHAPPEVLVLRTELEGTETERQLRDRIKLKQEASK